ncbi:hypothetical protein EAG_05335, partial [Camponotus floridanus]
KCHHYISDTIYKHLNSIHNVLLKVYELSKIHKPIFPFRVIVSSINILLHSLIAFLH